MNSLTSNPAWSAPNTMVSLCIGPLPIFYLRQIVADFGDGAPVLGKLIADQLLQRTGLSAEFRHAVDNIPGQMEAIQAVQYDHIKRRRGRALFLISPDMQVVVILSSIHQAMDKPGITMKCENDRFVV